MTPLDYDFLRYALKQRSGLTLGADKHAFLESRLLPIVRKAGLRAVSDLVLALKTGRDAALALRTVGEILGLLQQKPDAFLRRKKERWIEKQGFSVETIEELIQRRDQARSEKKWQEADRIRAELQKRGIILEDTPGGTIWKVR